MKATNIHIGHDYQVTQGRGKSIVRVTAHDIAGGAWTCRTEKGAEITVKDAKRFLKAVAAPAKTGGLGRMVGKLTSVLTGKGKKDDDTREESTSKKRGVPPKGKMSAVDAAARVLDEVKEPLNVKQIAEIADRLNYCELPGATPSATISSAIQKEIKDKGGNARFVRTERGKYTFNKNAT